MRLCVDVPEAMMKSMLKLIEQGEFKNKSELVRHAIRRLLEQYK